MSRSPITFRGGRRPAQPARPHLKFARLHPELPAPPTAADWLSPVPTRAWGMLGNDQYGDCTCAGLAHLRIGDVWANAGTMLNVDTDQTLELYSAVTGFSPDDPDSDRGALCQDVLAYWHKHGFLGEQVAAYARVDISDETELRQAIALYGQVYAGFNVPDSALRQFQNHEPWDVVAGARIEGGHCVTIGAYDADGLTVVTWGATQRMTWSFFREYFDEVWVTIGADDINPGTGRNRDGLDLETLEHDYRALTGRSVVTA